MLLLLLLNIFHLSTFVYSTETAHLVIKHYRAAQAAVEKSWAYDPELACAEPAVHGLVAKTASGTSSASMHHIMHSSMLAQYVFDRVPIYASCQVFISHKYKFLYVRQPKSSSTAIIKAIETTFCGEVCDATEFTSVQSYLNDTVWRDYFVFTWIRNPFTRIFSAFDMMNKSFLYQRQGPLGHEVGGHCSIDLATFTENTNSMRFICQQRGCCVYIAAMQSWIPWFIDQHINDQAHCTFTSHGWPMVDFIGRSEHIDSDWAKLLHEINRRTNSSFEAVGLDNPNGHGSTETGGIEHQCEAIQSRLNETIMFNIARQYASDLYHFQYLQTDPSALTLSVVP